MKPKARDVEAIPSIFPQVWERPGRILTLVGILAVAALAAVASFTPPDPEPDPGDGNRGDLRRAHAYATAAERASSGD